MPRPLKLKICNGELLVGCWEIITEELHIFEKLRVNDFRRKIIVEAEGALKDCCPSSSSTARKYRWKIMCHC
jgi:hypothetical protein